MILRTVYAVLCTVLGLAIAVSGMGEAGGTVPWGWAAAGLLTAGGGLLIEWGLRNVPASLILTGGLGSAAGLLIGGLFGWVVRAETGGLLPTGLLLFLTVILAYVGLRVGMRFAGEVRGVGSAGTVSGKAIGSKILDTSVIIDGRISDLCETGFLEGTFLIPQFILQELQHIADSSDSLKRARGRRGLDVLQKIQKMPDLDIRIVDNDFPNIRNVDAKIVALAREIGAKIVTNDLNLNKVAAVQGVKVLNINELCNALRPVVLPGESLRVFILKEGKEAGQGVAYLDDGTMIVVDNARRLIGKNVDVVVTSVLQTTAGRMIFTRPREENEREEAHVQG
jgi:uncharacterized protein YacL